MTKKLLSILVVLVLIAGCSKEKVYKENLEGTWEVYKYLLYNTDKTVQFQAQNPNYTISFTNGGTFTEFMTTPDSTYVNGTYTFKDNDEKIVLENTYLTFVLDTAGDSVFTSHTHKREYTIFNLTRDHVQLRNDSSQLYMDKLEIE
ncbi:MAG TPA: hypothetical protein VK154_16650 [Chitinophagales bacterium]|nr:hypothetical protein [Chitinophagales bacterium]